MRVDGEGLSDLGVAAQAARRFLDRLVLLVAQFHLGEVLPAEIGLQLGHVGLRALLRLLVDDEGDVDLLLGGRHPGRLSVAFPDPAVDVLGGPVARGDGLDDRAGARYGVPAGEVLGVGRLGGDVKAADLAAVSASVLVVVVGIIRDSRPPDMPGSTLAKGESITFVVWTREE